MANYAAMNYATEGIEYFIIASLNTQGKGGRIFDTKQSKQAKLTNKVSKPSSQTKQVSILLQTNL